MDKLTQDRIKKAAEKMAIEILSGHKSKLEFLADYTCLSLRKNNPCAAFPMNTKLCHSHGITPYTPESYILTAIDYFVENWGNEPGHGVQIIGFLDEANRIIADG
jgi:hypothetical protein